MVWSTKQLSVAELVRVRLDWESFLSLPNAFRNSYDLHIQECLVNRDVQCTFFVFLKPGIHHVFEESRL